MRISDYNKLNLVQNAALVFICQDQKPGYFVVGNRVAVCKHKHRTLKLAVRCQLRNGARVPGRTHVYFIDDGTKRIIGDHKVWRAA